MFIVTNTVHKYMKCVNSSVLHRSATSAIFSGKLYRIHFGMFPMNMTEVAVTCRGKL